jgi:RHS repeat-associated protein
MLIIPHVSGLPGEVIDADGRVHSGCRRLGLTEFMTTGQQPGSCPARYPGQWHDAETNLSYNRYRYFDPETTQYISPDPMGYSGGLNWYNYPRNPLTWSDPLGLIPGCPALDPQKVADEFEKQFGQRPQEIYLVGSYAEAITFGKWPPDPFSGPGKSDIDIIIITSITGLDKSSGPGFQFFSAINPGKVPPGITGIGYGKNETIIGNKPGNIPKPDTIDPFFKQNVSQMTVTPTKPVIRVWP